MWLITLELHLSHYQGKTRFNWILTTKFKFWIMIWIIDKLFSSSNTQSGNHTFSYLDDIADIDTIRGKKYPSASRDMFLRRDEETSSSAFDKSSSTSLVPTPTSEVTPDSVV